MEISDLLAFSVKNKASDLHLSSGLPPMIRVHGDIRRINVPVLSHTEVHGMVYDIMNDGQRKTYEENLEVDFSFEIPNLARFRVNAYVQNRGAAAVFRTIPSKVLSLEELKCPEIFKEISDQPRGIVLVTGPTGSGKSTTLAAMVDHINHNNPLAITTLEDPVEILHHDALGHITQREIGLDATSFATGVVEALRQDPDVILIGELRDRETIATAMLAAETGHLVLTTLHTKEATETVQRILATFPDDGRNGARVQLAACLRAVVSQRLIPRAGGAGRVPACEVMVVTDRIRDLIRRDLLHEIPDAIASGRTPYGMQNFDQALAELLAAGTITFDEALAHATRPADFALRYRGIVSGGEEVERGHHAGRPQSRGRG